MAPFGILFAIVFIIRFYAIYSSFFRQVTEAAARTAAANW